MASNLINDIKSRDFRVSLIIAVLTFLLTYLGPKVLHRNLS